MCKKYTRNEQPIHTKELNAKLYIYGVRLPKQNILQICLPMVKVASLWTVHFHVPSYIRQ